MSHIESHIELPSDGGFLPLNSPAFHSSNPLETPFQAVATSRQASTALGEDGTGIFSSFQPQDTLAAEAPSSHDVQPLFTARLPFSSTVETGDFSGASVLPQFDPLTGQLSEAVQVGTAAPGPFQSSPFKPQDTLLASEGLDINSLKAMRKGQIKALSPRRMKKEMSAIAAQTPFAQSIRHELVGSLGADAFTVSPSARYSILSGNGNVFFGRNAYDYLNLSSVHSSSARFNLAGINGPGVLYNDGKGARVFDALMLSNGNAILFEGLDRIYFADGYLNLATVPNDPLFSSQWNLHMMGVHNAWRFTTGSAETVLIGVQDTGLGLDNNGYLHPDLRAESTYVYRDNFADESYGLSHGTAVQSIIAARSNNGIGMSGINWNSDVLHADVLGGNANDMTLVQATERMISEANRRGQRLIINMSLGADTGGRVGLYPELERMVRENQDNVLFVVATGNANANYLSYPAVLANLYENVIAVGASWGAQDDYGNPREPGERISYPGWWGSNYGFGLSMMGPSEVVAAASTRTSFYSHSFGYAGRFNGTSAATPNVAGVASLVWSMNPNLTARHVHRVLAQTAHDLGRPDYDLMYGHGFVNADAAVRRAIALL
jgi:serine protease